MDNKACTGQCLVVYICVVLGLVCYTDAVGEVVFAVNCGGDTHMDEHGIRYQKDFLRLGTPSDYGRSLIIQRIGQQDQILYQTERYHTDTFGYDIPVKEDGNYILVLKFSEVWFNAPYQKVFDVSLNGMVVVEDLDIFGRVGRGTAHDEYIQFTVQNDVIRLKNSARTAKMENRKLDVRFLKKAQDNPKVNAIYLMKGAIRDVPRLPDLPNPEEQRQQQRAQQPPDPAETEDDDDDDNASRRKKRASSGPKVLDPYSAEETGSMMLPVFVAVGAFVPLVFCLCKL